MIEERLVGRFPSVAAMMYYCLGRGRRLIRTLSTVPAVKLLIDGEFRPSATDTFLDVRNPVRLFDVEQSERRCDLWMSLGNTEDRFARTSDKNGRTGCGCALSIHSIWKMECRSSTQTHPSNAKAPAAYRRSQGISPTSTPHAFSTDIRQEDLALAVTREHGKTLADARGDVFRGTGPSIAERAKDEMR